MGSISDKELATSIKEVLQNFEVESSVRVLSAHRTPVECIQAVTSASKDGFSMVIAVAGLSAHLPGVCAAHTELPVIGVGNSLGPLSGVDAALSMLMMPPGVPVACMGLGVGGAKNAALLAVRILSLSSQALKQKLLTYIQKQRDVVLQQDQDIQKEFFQETATKF